MGEVNIRCYGEDESVAGLDGQKVAELNAELEWPRAQGRRGIGEWIQSCHRGGDAELPDEEQPDRSDS